MGKKLMLAVALVALMAAPAFASVQNVKVGGELKTTSVIRDNFTLGKAAAATSQNVFLSQLGLTVQADLTDNVSTNFKFINERLWGTTGSNDVTVDTAYVTMKELLYSPLTVKVGRQPLQYGNQLLIGDGDLAGGVTKVSDLTGGVNFDAIKAILAYDPLTVDLFAAKVTEKDATAAEDKGDTDLYGINANYKLGDSMNTVVEAYTFVKATKAIDVSVSSKTSKLYVPGLRVSTNPIEGLNVQLEGAYELGKDFTTSTDTLSAYALQGGVNYALPVMKNMKPVVSAGYTYFSGDKTANDNKNHAFNALYNNQDVGRIYSALFAKNNLSVVNAGFEVTPIQDVTTKLSWYGLYQPIKTSALSINQVDGSTTPVAMGVKRSNRLGNEVDLDLGYAYTEDVKFGLSAGMFFGGTKISNAGSEVAKQVLTSVNVAF